MNEIKLTPLDDSIKEYWPPGYEFESMFTVDNPSYTVITRSVRLRDSMRSVNPRILSNSDTLIKYSEAKFSPVSSEPSKHIQFASPSYYQNLETDSNSELIQDDLESSYIERRKIGPYEDNQLTLTWGSNNFWMYCTSIAPSTKYYREKQMRNLSTDYDFGTRIESSSNFAEQLGREFGRQIKSNNNLRCNNYGIQMITLFLENCLKIPNAVPCMKKIPWERRRLALEKRAILGPLTGYSNRHMRVFMQLLENNSTALGDRLVFVDHGPVKYADRIEEYITSFPEEHHGYIIPFVKRSKYADQSEYRFLVYIQFYSPNEEVFHLEVSDGLIDLMQPVELQKIS